MSAHTVTLQPAAKNRWLPVCSCGWVGCVAGSKETALRVAQADHVDRQHAPCPTPGKKRFKRRETAEAEMRLFWRTAGKGKAMPTRVYECCCGGWHTTSKPLRRSA